MKTATLRLQITAVFNVAVEYNFFKMVTLITSFHDVVQEFIEKPCRATINLDKYTCTSSASEVFQLSCAVIKRHTLRPRSD